LRSRSIHPFIHSSYWFDVYNDIMHLFLESQHSSIHSTSIDATTSNSTAVLSKNNSPCLVLMKPRSSGPQISRPSSSLVHYQLFLEKEEDEVTGKEGTRMKEPMSLEGLWRLEEPMIGMEPRMELLREKHKPAIGPSKFAAFCHVIRKKVVPGRKTRHYCQHLLLMVNTQHVSSKDLQARSNL
jgi:hypothetical protein